MCCAGAPESRCNASDCKCTTWESATHAVVSNKLGANAVLPAWREAGISAFVLGTWNFTAKVEDNLQVQKAMRQVVEPALKGVETGTYLNEADFGNPDWKEDFYGNNWGRLLEVKSKWGSEGLLWARAVVGSEGWSEGDEGRLCRVCG